MKVSKTNFVSTNMVSIMPKKFFKITNLSIESLNNNLWKWEIRFQNCHYQIIKVQKPVIKVQKLVIKVQKPVSKVAIPKKKSAILWSWIGTFRNSFCLYKPWIWGVERLFLTIFQNCLDWNKSKFNEMGVTKSQPSLVKLIQNISSH